MKLQQDAHHAKNAIGECAIRRSAASNCSRRCLSSSFSVFRVFDRLEHVHWQIHRSAPPDIPQQSVATSSGSPYDILGNVTLTLLPDTKIPMSRISSARRVEMHRLEPRNVVVSAREQRDVLLEARI